MKKRVILVGDERKPGVAEAIESARIWVSELAELVAVDLDQTLDFRSVSADLVVIFGGDGSILSTARRMGDEPTPSVGVNFGKFGFLTDIRARSVRDELTRVLSGELVVEQRLMLRARVEENAGGEDFLALNDVYLGPGTVGRMSSIELFLDDEYANTFRGDGLLVATPTGSTGHSLSAGGPILDPNLGAIILTPVSSHSLTNRPLVIPPHVTVKLRPQPDHGRTPATFSVDGQLTTEVEADQTVTVRRASRTFPLVRTGLRSRYAVLRNRLGWSGHPPYDEQDGEEGTGGSHHEGRRP